MSAIVRVVFDASTDLPPLVTSGAKLDEQVGRYLRRAYNTPLFVDVANEVGAAYNGSALVASFSVYQLGGAA